MSIMEKFKLDGKVALVTGCSKGIGFGIAKGLAEAGADIIGVSSTLKKGSEIEKYVESIGKRFYCFNCDFSERENTHSFLNDLKKQRSFVNAEAARIRQPAKRFSERKSLLY